MSPLNLHRHMRVLSLVRHEKSLTTMSIAGNFEEN